MKDKGLNTRCRKGWRDLIKNDWHEGEDDRMTVMIENDA